MQGNIIPVQKIIKTTVLVSLIGDLGTVIGTITPDKVEYEVDPSFQHPVFDRDFGVIYFKSQGQKEAMLN